MILKRIMFLCHGAGNGGAERVITTLAGEFTKKYNVLLITTNESYNDYVLNPKVKHYIILSKKNNVVFRSIDRIIRLRNYIKMFKPDCIVSFSSIPNMQAIVANIGLKSKLIISERTDPSRYPASDIGKKLRGILYPHADRIVFQTKQARDYFPRRIKQMSTIIPNPIRNDLPSPYIGEREKRIVGIGSLGEQKNWDVALDACEMLFREYTDYILDIYGEGPFRDRLQKRIDSSDVLRNRVFLKGFSQSVVEEMLKAKMYISSSDYEGISNSMLEALAVGVPTICTDCPVGGARENIEDGISGLLIPVRDSKALYIAMKKIIETDCLSNQLSHNSVKITRKLSLDKIVKQWEEEVEKSCK